jgi:hypothetical protein
MEDIPLFTLSDEPAGLCRPGDFARAHDVPVQTLYSAAASGRIVYVKHHGRLYLQLKSAENFMTIYRKLTPAPKEN